MTDEHGYVPDPATEPSDAALREVALTREEYREACRRVGRDLNAVELGIVGGMWSEHCGYQHSRPLLKNFPTTGRRVLPPETMCSM